MTNAIIVWGPFLLRLAFGLCLLSAVVLYSGVERLVEAAAALQPAWFWSAFAASLVGSILVPAVITRSSMKVVGLSFPMSRLLKINLTMRFYVLTLPHAVTVGLRWLRYRDVKRDKGFELAAVIAFERAVQLFVVTATSAMFLFFRMEVVPPRLTGLFPISIVLAALMGGVVLLFVSAPAFNLIRPVLTKATASTPAWISHYIDRLLMSAQGYHQLGGGRLVQILILCLGAHLLFVGSGYLISLGLQLPFAYMDIGWMRSVVYLLTLLPVTIGGIGIRETGFAALFVIHGVPAEEAVAFPLLLLAMQLLIGAGGGAVELIRVLSTPKNIDAATA